ncbi:hypothetical protein ABI59_19750 [Acidobacteria bacterium Mor1]|nr:hypothetical protein ABI59_19750 [Acidobacteria bacterium Mor1]
MPLQNMKVDVLVDSDHWRNAMRSEVRAGLLSTPKRLPSKYFYDTRGSDLFEEITDLPEYYQTRTEQALLERCAGEICRIVRPLELIELGAGSSKKTRMLLDAATAENRLERYIPLEVSEGMARQSGADIAGDYPGIDIHAVVGDFDHHLTDLPSGTRRLVVFLGSTIGNMVREDAIEFLREVSQLLDSESALLLGTDLVKDKQVLEAAYNDARGVTAAFNLNILSVINNELAGNFNPEGFEHVAFFNEDEERIEMHLKARTMQRARLEDLEMNVAVQAGEMIHTEVSCKYRKESVQAMLGEAGLELEHWYTDPKNYFALSLARRAR